MPLRRFERKNMQLKKLAIVFLVVVAMLSCVGVFSLAQDGPSASLDLSVEMFSPTELSEQGDKFIVKPGDIVKTVIRVEANPGVGSLQLYFNYDPNAVEYVKYYEGSVFSKNGEGATWFVNTDTPGEIAVVIVNDMKEDFTFGTTTVEDSVLVTLEFRVSDSHPGNINSFALSDSEAGLYAGDSHGDKVECNIIKNAETVYAHDFGTSKPIPGDCETANKEEFTCVTCGEKVISVLGEPIGHSYEFVSEVPATCVTPGTKAHYKCNRPDCTALFESVAGENGETTPGEKVSAEALVIANGGHQYGELVPEVPANCVEAGKEAHYVCELCGQLAQKAEGSDVYTDVTEADIVIPSNNGHLYTFVPEIPADCENEGKEAHYVCERESCGQLAQKSEGSEEYVDVKSEDLVILALGHAYKSVDLVPALCEKEGKAAHFTCDRCPKLFVEVDGEKVATTVEELVIPALEHILGDIVEYVAPSAAEFGFEAHYLCARGCGQYFNADGEKSTYNDLLIDKLPPEIKEADDFWVKGDANSKVEFKSDGHIDDFKDFWFNGSKLEKDKDYTVREGSIIVTLTDSFLETIDPGKTYEIGIESVSGIAKTTFEVGHDYGELVDRSEPTCMTNGNLPYYYCGAKCCNTYFDANKNIIAENVTDIPAQLVLKALGHKPAGAMIAAKAPTCTEIGYTIACYKCRVCDGYYNMSATGDFYDLSADVIEIPALGHNGVTKVDAKAPDCENAGNVEHFLCERCGKTVNADNEVIEVVLSALGHNGVTKVEAKAPTCEDDGNIEHFLCERCGKTVNADNEVIDAVIPKNGHSYGELIAQVDPTCEGTGTEAHYVCSVCGQLAQKAEGAEDYTKVTADDLVISAAGHKYGELIAQVDPTCEGTGVIAYYKCSVCEKTFNSEMVEVTDLVIPAKGHEYGDLIAKVPATTEKDGAIAHYHCSACGKYFDAAKVEVSSIVIPKLPKIVSSPEEPWVKGSDDSLSFVSDAKFEDFVSVKLNGALLSESDYNLEKTEDGKTKITLEPATLEKLEAADYTITITSVNGSCDAGFTVENSSAVLAIVIVVIAVVVIGAGAAAAIVVLKKKNLI